MSGVMVKSSKIEEGACVAKHGSELSKLYMGVKLDLELDVVRSNRNPDSQMELSTQLKYILPRDCMNTLMSMSNCKNSQPPCLQKLNFGWHACHFR